MLLFNGNAFRGLGSFIGGGENLCSRLRESWALALGLHPVEGSGLVHYPENGQYEVKAGDQSQFEQLFFRASYLSKAATKSFRNGVHVFGSSQI